MAELTHLVNKSAALKASDLTPAYVRHLEVSVQEQVERERNVLARVVHADVEVQLFLAQDEPVGQPEREVPHRPRDLVVHYAKHGLDVAGRQTLGRLLDVPADDSSEAVLRPVVPGAEVRCGEANESLVSIQTTLFSSGEEPGESRARCD